MYIMHPGVIVLPEPSRGNRNMCSPTRAREALPHEGVKVLCSTLVGLSFLGIPAKVGTAEDEPPVKAVYDVAHDKAIGSVGVYANSRVRDATTKCSRNQCGGK